ncbi:hypothetical protein J6590_066148 [Homalodisca vitripennis]|nr:hypothetical protein J6590_066148 [Homalodisca vitripennis]
MLARTGSLSGCPSSSHARQLNKNDVVSGYQRVVQQPKITGYYSEWGIPTRYVRRGFGKSISKRRYREKGGRKGKSNGRELEKSCRQENVMKSSPVC